MKEIRHDILSDPGKFELICLPVSCYQKKDGSYPAQKGSMLESFAQMCPTLLTDLGGGVERYGNCPAILGSIPNTPIPTKFITFPVAPTSLRAHNPNLYVYQRFQDKFKENSVLPGWVLLPRSDMVEFAAIKLKQIMKFYKLTKVAIPFEMFTLERNDREDYVRIQKIINQHITEGLYLVSKPMGDSKGVVHTNVQSSVTYEDEEA